MQIEIKTQVVESKLYNLKKPPRIYIIYVAYVSQLFRWPM